MTLLPLIAEAIIQGKHLDSKQCLKDTAMCESGGLCVRFMITVLLSKNCRFKVCYIIVVGVCFICFRDNSI
jgi:hypothetical protein